MHFCSLLILDQDTHHMSSLFKSALTSILAYPDQPFNEWSDISSIATSISNPHPPAATNDYGDCIHYAFERSASLKPNDTAIAFLHPDGNVERWTYKAANDLAERIAVRLRQDFDVQIEDTVPIGIPRSPLFYISLLAVLKAGAGFTPLGNAPAERKKLMIDELRPKLVILGGDETASWCHARVLNLHSLLANKDIPEPAKSANKPADRVAGSNLVYRMYTSGSTGWSSHSSTVSSRPLLT